MPRIAVTTECTAQLTEEWVLDVTADQLADIDADRSAALDILDADTSSIVGVENTGSDNEHDREIREVRPVPDDYTGPAPAPSTVAQPEVSYAFLDTGNGTGDETVAVGPFPTEQAAADAADGRQVIALLSHAAFADSPQGRPDTDDDWDDALLPTDDPGYDEAARQDAERR